jgi:hypothetical protein
VNEGPECPRPLDELSCSFLSKLASLNLVYPFRAPIRRRATPTIPSTPLARSTSDPGSGAGTGTDDVFDEIWLFTDKVAWPEKFPKVWLLPEIVSRNDSVPSVVLDVAVPVYVTVRLGMSGLSTGVCVFGVKPVFCWDRNPMGAPRAAVYVPDPDTSPLMSYNVVNDGLFTSVLMNSALSILITYDHLKSAPLGVMVGLLKSMFA